MDARSTEITRADTPEKLADVTRDRSTFDQARETAMALPPQDRVEAELAMMRAADVEVRATAQKLAAADAPSAAVLRESNDAARRTMTDASAAIHDAVPAADLPAAIIDTAARAHHEADSIVAMVESHAEHQAAFEAIRQDHDLAGDPSPAATVEPDDHTAEASRHGEASHDDDAVDVIEHAIDGYESQADALRDRAREHGQDADAAQARADSIGAALDAQLGAIEIIGTEEGDAGVGGADLDYVLNDQVMTRVLTGIVDEAEATGVAEVAAVRAELADLRSELADEMAGSLAQVADTAFANAVDATTATRPYAEQLDAFAGRAQVAAAEYEQVATNRIAIESYRDELDHDVGVLEARLAAAETVYLSSSAMSFETITPLGSGGLDLIDYRLNHTAFDGAVGALRDIGQARAELAARRAVLADVDAEIEMLEARMTDAEEDLARAEARLDDAEIRFEHALAAEAAGDELPPIDPDAVARADLEEVRDDLDDLHAELQDLAQTSHEADADAFGAGADASAAEAVADAHAATSFQLPHGEIEFRLGLTGPVPVHQTDMGVNDAALQAALDEAGDAIAATIDAAAADARSELAAAREAEVEAMLLALEESEVALVDEVGPPPDGFGDGAEDPDPTDAEQGAGTDEPVMVDGTPDVAVVDPNAAVDLDFGAGVEADQDVIPPDEPDLLVDPETAPTLDPSEPVVVAELEQIDVAPIDPIDVSVDEPVELTIEEPRVAMEATPGDLTELEP